MKGNRAMVWQRQGATSLIAAVILLSGLSGPAIQATAAEAPPAAATFTNPLLRSGPDPWITQHEGVYYYMHTLGNRIALWRTENIADLANAEQRVVWKAPASGPNAHSIWAPELHRLDGKWYLYYSATASGFKDDQHRAVFVLENAGSDPMKGEWVDRGRVNTEHAGIDGTVFDHGGKRYFVYSPYLGADSGLAIAEMENPWTLTGQERVIARRAGARSSKVPNSCSDRKATCSSPIRRAPAGPTIMRSDCCALQRDPIRSIPQRGSRRRSPSSSAPTGSMRPGITAFSCRPTARKTGSSITPTPAPT